MRVRSVTFVRWRKRFPFFRVFGVISLTFGFIATLTIAFYVSSEFRFDKSHDDANRIYLVGQRNGEAGMSRRSPKTPLVLGTVLQNEKRKEFETVRVVSRKAQVRSTENKVVKIDDFVFADPGIPGFFTFRFLSDAPDSLRLAENTIILSSKTAKLLFDSIENALHQTVIVEDSLALKVAAVFEEWPRESHLKVDAISSIHSYFQLEYPIVHNFLQNDWIFNPAFTYIKVRDHESQNDVNTHLAGLRSATGDGPGNDIEYTALPLGDLHLQGFDQDEALFTPAANVLIMIVIGLFALLVSGLNYASLAMIGWLRKTREIFLHMAYGEGTDHLQKRLMVRIAIDILLATVFSLATCFGIWEFFDHSVVPNPYQLLAIVSFLALIAVVFLTVCLFISPYAKRLRALIPVRGKDALPWIQSTSGKSLIRRLTIIQFTMASVLVFFTLSVNRQIAFLKSRNLGLTTDNILTIPILTESVTNFIGNTDQSLLEKVGEFESRLADDPGVVSMTLASALPGDASILAEVIYPARGNTMTKFIPLLSVDSNYLDLYGIPVIAGSGFSLIAEKKQLLVSRSCLAEFGFSEPDEILGLEIVVIREPGVVVGVVENFLFEGYHSPVKPVILQMEKSRFGFLAIRTTPESDQEELEAKIEGIWNETLPGRYLAIESLDDRLKDTLVAESAVLNASKRISLVAILVSVFGLVSFSAFVAEQTKKELGIRKVSGASSKDLCIILFRRQAGLIVYSLLVGFPLSFWISGLWLSRFEFTTTITWSDFLIAHGGLIAIILISSTYYILESIRSNPVTILRAT